MSDMLGSEAVGAIEMSSSNKSPYALVPAMTSSEKVSADLSWVNLNFKVKDKSILTKCWGKV